MHPTVKPVALIADALRDCSERGALVLDIFGGSGSTLIAAQQCGRAARLIEYDPLYCDVTIRRFERITGKSTKLLPPFAYTYVPDANGADGGYYPDNIDPYSNAEVYGATPGKPAAGG